MQTAENVARWFLDRNRLDRKENIDVEGISNLKLQKLLYYVYGCYLGAHNAKLFEESFYAWEHGPVVPSIYHEYKGFESHSIDDYVKPIDNFTDEEIDALEWVYNEFGQYTAWGLRNKTHEERPWLDTPRGEKIDDDLIYSYFEENYIVKTN